jgi:hypothetical protein
VFGAFGMAVFSALGCDVCLVARRHRNGLCAGLRFGASVLDGGAGQSGGRGSMGRLRDQAAAGQQKAGDEETNTKAF